MRKLTTLLFIQLVVGVYFVIIYYSEEVIESQEKPMKKLKNILIWNSVHRIETAYFNVGSASFVNSKCPVHQCQIFTERSSLPFEQYDAVVMNMLELHYFKRPEVEGLIRSKRQRFIFLQQESPRTSPLKLRQFDNYFNWTMTYKLNSDILLLYGRVKPKHSAPKKEMEVQKFINDTHQWSRNYAANKTKMLAWMVSHCETYSNRENYVNELRKYVEVDVFGGCGSKNFTCPRSDHWIPDPQCYVHFAAHYKFYLSFENSACDDYVTEKFFNILAHDLVPVVYGGANYSKLAPPHSFIDAMQFTPRQLARYLNRIANDDRLYNEFFWWKEHYEVETGIEQMVRHAFCDLCQKLHEDSVVQYYKDLRPFWGQFQCQLIERWDKYPRSITNSSKDFRLKRITWMTES